MRFDHKRSYLVVGLAVLLSASNVLAQQWPDEFSKPPYDGAGSSLIDSGGSGGQIRFLAEYLFLDRDTDFDQANLITGPDGFSASDVGFDRQSGYRLGLAVVVWDWEVEATVVRLDQWDTRRSGTLVDALTFDDTINSAFYGGPAPHNSYAFPNALFFAATNNDPFDDLSGTDDETLEAEFLMPLSTLTFDYQSELEDVELNFKSPWIGCHFRFGIGFRDIDLNELAQLTVSGVFDTVDSATGLEADINDGLSHQALISSGLTLLSGAADGWDDENAAPAGPDVLILDHAASTRNLLDGVQFTFDASLLTSERWFLDTYLKAGVFHNRTRGTVTETYTGFANDDSVYGRTFSDSRSTVAFAGNLGLRGTAVLTKNIRFRTAYEALFLAGVALAPDQFLGVTSNGPDARYQVYADGQVIAHGGSLGLELVW